MPAAVFSLACAAFAIGATEFVIVGLLPDIGRAFGISVSTAGLLVSFYALAITVGTPVVSALTARLPRRALLLALMSFFTLCNLGAGLSTAFAALLTIRIVMAVAHGVFFGLGTTVAMALVPPQKSGRAVAIMVSGLTVAMVTGVPGGTWLGDLMNWRLPFLVVAAMGEATVVLVARRVAPDAVGTAAGLNVAAFNLGISGGSFLGGLTITGVSALTTVYAGVALAVVGLVVVALYRWSDRPGAAHGRDALGRC
ncbi:MFS transporter [Paraburkholderia phenoliruptrix]|uniref:MFS transporter n=1 Tax=Paraburkholderia phenoliruptrix TaxID=252970 RepID=UPI002869E24B|nr:MFS transporter [Paraburkholderia phenoliruptrix]WMY12189.1 MFS transporter [Paraburkholderia phenoliruptrix]